MNAGRNAKLSGRASALIESIYYSYEYYSHEYYTRKNNLIIRMGADNHMGMSVVVKHGM